MEDNEKKEGVYKSRRSYHTKLVKRLWLLLLLGFLGVVCLFLFLSLGDLPTFEQLENPRSETATEIFSSDGVLLGRYFVKNRIDVKYEELPEHLVNALIATEDERFKEHSGIDKRALARVATRTVLGGDKSGGGGSTLTQQLAKLLFDRPPFIGNPFKKIWVMGTTKLKEWITAVKLERSYTKEEILTMYLNKFNFIHGAYGIRSASEIYFGKTQDSLSIEEAATLVGMLKNPSLFNPISRPDTTLHRRMIVLYQMMKNKMITKAEYDSLRVLPLNMSQFKKVDHNDGLAPHFREYLREDVKKILKDNPKLDGSTYSIYEDGLRIYTTIDSRMQQHAENAAMKHLAKMQGLFFEHWNKRDPWKYRDDIEKITDDDLKRRQQALTKQIRASKRYEALRNKHLNLVIKQKYRDVDIDRLFEAEKKRDQIDKWVKTKFIGPKLADKYNKTLKSKDWKAIKKEWKTLEEAVKKAFGKKEKMTVFAYNDRYQTDTLMTPMDSIKYNRMQLQTGFMAVEPQSGYIKAWVGGTDHRFFKYDHTNKSVARQIGSTFKPFLYAISIDLRGYSPCHQVIDQPVTIEKGTFHLREDWTPKNVGEYTNAPITLMQALKESKNSVSAYLMKDMGSPEPLRDLIGNMGIDLKRVPPVPSICLGTPDLSVFEMTGAYTAFANGGIVSKPIYINRIEDKNGNVIYESIIEQKQVLSEQANHVMIQMLKNVIGSRLGLETINGGKTGTTNSHADAWYMGVTPNLVAGTWVGCDDRWLRFRDLRYGQGAVLARPIFQHFMKAVEADEALEFDKTAMFPEPSGPLEIELDCAEYQQFSDRVDIDSESMFPNDPYGEPEIEEEEEDDEFEFGGDDDWEDDFEDDDGSSISDYPGQKRRKKTTIGKKRVNEAPNGEEEDLDGGNGGEGTNAPSKKPQPSKKPVFNEEGEEEEEDDF